MLDAFRFRKFAASQGALFTNMHPLRSCELANLGVAILACGTCLKSRQLGSFRACPISTMVDCEELVLWADKTVAF